MLYKKLSGNIIKSFYKVYNDLGYGFLEKVYENALSSELKNNGLKCHSQHPVKVYYDGLVVGKYFADLIVEKKIIIELKAAEHLSTADELQLLNYLRATKCKIGLLLNFGRKPEFKRKIYTK
jgi:GxxExxY protein